MTLALAIAMAQSSNASTICLSGSPCYTIGLLAPGGSMLADSGPLATSGTILGLDPAGFGSGSAFAVASFGRVGAKSEAIDTVPDIFDEPIKATADSQFTDQFIWGGGSGALRFTLHLDGSVMLFCGIDIMCPLFGNPAFDNVAFVAANFLLTDTFDSAAGTLIGPGTLALTIKVGPGERVNLSLDLETEVSLLHFGNGTANFSDTAQLTTVEQLDTSGNFVQDVTLTDNQGNVLGAPAAVPEPATVVLVAASLIALRILAGGARGGVLFGQPTNYR
jgi:hypothetical protein